MFKRWLDRMLGADVQINYETQHVPPDQERRQTRIEARRATLNSMRRLAVTESDPDFLSYVEEREKELARLEDAQLDEEYDIITRGD